MKAVNLWKTLFCAALALTTFSACSDDDKDDDGGMPSITVNGEASTTVAVKLDGGTTDAIEVVSTGSWVLTLDDETATWCHPSKETGSKGKTTLTFTVDPWEGAASTAERSVTAKLLTNGSFEGIPIPKTATIKIVQSDNEVPTGNALYSENCGTKVEKVGEYWPYVDQFDGWTRGGALDQKGVTYDGSSSSVANSGKAFDPAEDEKQEVSGPPYVSMNKSTSVFYIKDINIASNTNFTFTFTAAQQVDYSGGVILGDVTDETIRFSVTTDGEGYAPVAVKVKKVGTGYWYLGTAQFKLPAGVSVDKITVRFDNYAGLANHGLRIDDFKLYEGGNGSELVVPEPTTATIADIKEPGDYELKGVTVVNRSDMAYIIADNTGSMLVYHSGNERKVGDKIDISGAVTIYSAPNNPPQFSEDAVVVVVSEGNSWSYDFKSYTETDINAYFNNISCTPIELKGTIVADGERYFNLILDGMSENLQGSVQYYTPDADKLNAPVVVKGYAVGKSEKDGITRIKIFPYEVTIDSSKPYINATAPATFKFEGETINVEFKAGNLGSNKVFAKLDDAAQFSVGTVGETSVPVTAKANDGAAKSATLTLYIAASVDATAVASTTVALKQAAKPSGDEGAPYTWSMLKGELTMAGGLVAKGEPAMEWTASEATYIGWDSNASAKGIQIGSSGKPEADFTLTTANYSGKITSIKVNASIGSGGDGKLTVKIGDTQIGEPITLTTTATTYTFTPASPVAGSITIGLSATAKAMYIKSVDVNPAE